MLLTQYVDKFQPFANDSKRTLKKVKGILSQENEPESKIQQLQDLGQRINYLARKKTEMQAPIKELRAKLRQAKQERNEMKPDFETFEF